MRLRDASALGFALLLCVSAVYAGGGDPAYQLSASNESGTQGSSVTVDINLTSTSGLIQGWSWGVCTANPLIAEIVSVADGTTTATVKAGAAPDFNQKNIIGTSGWTVGVVISFIGAATLPTGAGYLMNTANYDVVGAMGVTALDFCDTLGVPPVATVIVVAGGSIVPQTTSGSITVIVQQPFDYIAGNETVTYDPADGVASFTSAVQILGNGPSATASTQGFSMGLSHDGSLMSCTAVAEAPALDAINPSFFQATFSPTLANGWTVGVVYSFIGGVFLQFPAATDVAIASYSSVPAALTGDLDGATSPLDWSDALGMPPVANVVVVGGQSIPAGFGNGSVTFVPQTVVDFVRSDCNGDGAFDIADGIWNINELFLGGPASTCFEACDANDDGFQDASDSTYIFNYQFLAGPPPPAPFPGCGNEGDTQDCDAYAGC
ncbi:MAG: hypothetical protein ACKVX7_13320 [Planctomycetota bacterium]